MNANAFRHFYLLNDLGVKTESQDYIFYVYDNP